MIFLMKGRNSLALADKKTILIVDDQASNISVMGDVLSPYYKVRAANSGKRALSNLQKAQAVDLILLDVMMPDMDGYAVLNELRNNVETRNIPVIFVTAMDETDDEEYGLELGAVDYMTKPIRPAILLARVRTQLALKDAKDRLIYQNNNLEAEVQRRIAESNLIRDIGMKALSSLAKTRDNETGGHILRTQGYIDLLARELALKPDNAAYLSDKKIDYIVKAAPLHDIGKVGIPDAILLKPGKLTIEEFEVMKQHAKLGADALRSCIDDVESVEEHKELEFLNVAIEISQHHHEKWDGSGYPDGLSGESIPLPARLMALADVFDALISRRVYKAPFSFEDSVHIIIQGSGGHFDPQIVEVFKLKQLDLLEISKRYAETDIAYD